MKRCVTGLVGFLTIAVLAVAAIAQQPDGPGDPGGGDPPAREDGPGDRPEGDQPKGDAAERPEGDRPEGDRPQGDRPQGERGRRPMSLLMRALDTNQDGALTEDEIAKAVESIKTLDKNMDGTVSRDELRLQSRGDGPGPGVRRPRGDGDRPDGDRPRGDGDRPRGDGDRPDGGRPDTEGPQGHRPDAGQEQGTDAADAQAGPAVNIPSLDEVASIRVDAYERFPGGPFEVTLTEPEEIEPILKWLTGIGWDPAKSKDARVIRIAPAAQLEIQLHDDKPSQGFTLSDRIIIAGDRYWTIDINELAELVKPGQ